MTLSMRKMKIKLWDKFKSVSKLLLSDKSCKIYSFSVNIFFLKYIVYVYVSWQILNVTADQADTYKCFATNSFGRAVCTASLKVIEGKT